MLSLEFCRLSLKMFEPRLVVELLLSQTEAISSTSSNTPEGKAAKSVPYSAKEDVAHECKTNNNISPQVRLPRVHRERQRPRSRLGKTWQEVKGRARRLGYLGGMDVMQT